MKKSLFRSPLLTVILLTVLTGCSSDKKSSEPIVSADTAARSAINNGYYLKDQLEYGADGALIGSKSFEVDYSALTITSRDNLLDANPINAIYSFSSDGDLDSIKYFFVDGPDTLDGSEYLELSLTRGNGVLEEIFWDYKLGTESDLRIQNIYGDSERLSQVVTTNMETQNSFKADYIYNGSGQLESIIEEDPERPGETISRTFMWNDDGSLQSEIFEAGAVSQLTSYDYDDVGNVFSISTADQDGGILGREDLVYTEATNPVFNLILERLYYHR